MHNLLQKPEKCDTLLPELTAKQLIKLMRRLQALPDGRHEVILTIQNGVQDWTVRQIGKVER